MVGKIGQIVSGGITKMQGANMVPTIKPVKTVSIPSSNSGTVGSGWFQEKVRHSNAKKFGKAGGAYAYKKKINAKKLTWDELKDTGIDPHADADEDGYPNEDDCQPLDPEKDLSIADIKEGFEIAEEKVGGKITDYRGKAKKIYEEKIKPSLTKVENAISEAEQIMGNVAHETNKALQSVNPKAIQDQIDKHKASKEKIVEVISKLTEERDFLVNNNEHKKADKIMDTIKNLQTSIDKITQHEQKLQEHKEKIEAVEKKIGEGINTAGKVATTIAEEEKKFFTEGNEPNLEIKQEPQNTNWKPQIVDDLEFFSDEETPAPKPQYRQIPEGMTELELGILDYYDEDPNEYVKAPFSFSEELERTNSQGNEFARLIDQEKKLRGEK